jgi:uncharacterized protein affecting Mg2+/Co2+ transport
MVTYGLPVVYTLNINLINHGENRFLLISREWVSAEEGE